ncbi:MAG TPA: fasciclin domain-containing protein [Bacteroidales bacterium]|nr:fasciclin domain-containing protein [Bacteroidales bacterium]
MKRIHYIFKKITLAGALLLSSFYWTGCVDNDPVVENYYTFTGETVKDYLNNREESYSQFIRVLDKVHLMDLLSTYGEYTCLAPTNDAIEQFLLERNLSSLDQLTFEECDTLARTHLIRGAFYTTDLEDGALPNTNFMDRYLMYSTAADTTSGTAEVLYTINKTAQMIVRDDSVSNGVVHTLGRVIQPSNLFLPQLMAEDSLISIFMDALMLTGLDKKMEAYIDESYSVSADSIDLKLTWDPAGVRQADYPSTRKFGFTAFVEPNSVYNKRGIYSVDDLVQKLISKELPVWDPYGRYTYDENFTDSTNVVYRFVSYHLLDRLGNYSSWNVSPTIRDNQAVYENLDPQDFFETMCPFTMMKFQTDRSGELYINRRRVNEGAAAVRDSENPFAVAVRGVRVYQPSETPAGGDPEIEQSALNGVYHYIDNLLIYDATTADVLNTRMRIDASTLSPDFMNNVGRGRATREVVTRYKPGFVTNFNFTDQTEMGVREDPMWSPSYQCNGLDFMGQYDFSFKLPPVPEGTYEIRIGLNTDPRRGIVQIYLDNRACGIPIDMRISKFDNPRIGALADSEDEEENRRNDKDLRNRGFMKGPDSWMTGDGKTETHRNFWNSVRIILSTETLKEGEVHYLRFKSVIDNPLALLPIDYLELCPKTVYDNPEGEDTH